MKGLRIFDRFGFDLPKEQEKNSVPPIVTKNYNEWVFDIKAHDWLNTSNEDGLTEYIPHSDLVDLLANRVDTELE
jgi:hypothetical protein